METEITTTAIVIFMALFFGVGVVMTVRTMLEARRHGTSAPGTWRERLRVRVGPVTPNKAPLSPPLRVLVEFSCALFGFPGLGWSLSTRLVPGVGLMLVGPILCWMVYPIFLYHSGILSANVYTVFYELPFVAVLSAGTLAAFELRDNRRRHASIS